MIELMQIMSHMIQTLGYSSLEIDMAFTDIINGDESIETLLEVIGVEPTERQLKSLKAKLHLYESALHVTELKVG